MSSRGTSPEKSGLQGYLLSPQQRRLWHLQRDHSPFQAQCALLLEGELQPAALNTAFQRLIERHEILRTAFQPSDGFELPLQVANPNGSSSWEQRGLPQGQSEDDMLDSLLRRDRDLPFDLTRGPFVRASLYALSPSRHLLILSLPALCADSRTLGNLPGEMGRLYAAAAGGKADPEEPFQYARFSEWQNALLEDEEARDGMVFWRHFDPASFASMTLPFENPSTDGLRSEPQRTKRRLGCDLVSTLRGSSRRFGVALPSLLLSGWQALLWRLSGQRDVLVGCRADGREYEILQMALGLYARWLPARFCFRDEQRFCDMIKQVDEASREASEWQSYFRLESNCDACFSAGFEFEERPPAFRSAGVTFSLLESHIRGEIFHLKLACRLGDDSLDVELEWNAKRFQAEDMKRLCGQFERLLGCALRDPERLLPRLEILSLAEQRWLQSLNEGQKLKGPGEAPFHRLFEDQAKRLPQAVAVVFEERCLTYGNLNRQANQLARRLRRMGIGPGALAGLCLERSPELIAAMLAVLKAGGAYLPLNLRQPAHRTALLLEDARPSALLSRAKPAHRLPESRPPLLKVDPGACSQERRDNLSECAATEDLAYVLFTSGSTGRPKGVAVEHRQVLCYLAAILEVLDLPAGSSYALISTLSADLGNTVLFSSLATGGRLHLISEERASDPEGLADYFVRRPNDCLKIVPSHLAALLRAASSPQQILPRQRLVLGGEASRREWVQDLQNLVPECRILNHYGPTETTVGVMTYRVANEAGRRSANLPLGRPLAGSRIYLLDRFLERVPTWVPGHLHIGGATLSRGYLHRPALTAEAFIPDPFSIQPGARLYRSGDLARHLPNGDTEFLGRIDQQVKLRGFRIELGEVEAALRRHPGVGEAVVMLREDLPADARLVAYLTSRHTDSPASASPLSTAKLRRALQELLPEHMLPSVFVVLEKLPLTPNGKLDRRALPAPANVRPDLERPPVAPRNPVEAQLAQIWRQVLGLDRVGVDDNFFELGGDSILTIQVIARANQAGLRLTARQAFQHQTIAGLAAAAGAGPAVRAEQGTVRGEIPLTPAQHRFFEAFPSEAHHWNQSVLLETDARLEASALEEAVECLAAQHDTLRLRFRRGGTTDGWRQFNAGLDDGSHLSLCRLDLSALDAARQPEAVEKACSRLQSSLNLESGPLMRAAFFRMGAEKRGRLLLVVHHLAVDGVSWRILLEDLHSACLQRMRGEAVRLPPKTTSFKEWACLLQGHAQSDEARREADHWLVQTSVPSSRLPLDRPQGDNLQASARIVTLSLDESETESLLREAPRSYRTQIADLLLTALAQAVTEWTGGDAMRIDLEGHGREDLFEAADLSRTVGFFTNVYPVTVRLKGKPAPGTALKSVKEQLRQAARRGFSYGLLRYMAKEPELRQGLKGSQQPEIAFNYLGQFDQTLPSASLFGLASENAGADFSPRGQRRYRLRINANVLRGRLQINCSYSPSLHLPSTVERFMHSLMGRLRSLIEHCKSHQAWGRTPSDFPLAGLGQTRLDQLLEGRRDVEALYPLSPIQEGMLFHSLLESEADVYFHHLSFRIREEVDEAAFEKAWQQAVARHPALRTGLLWKDLPRPLQCVQKKSTLEMERHDWRDLTGPKEEEARLQDFLQDDLKRGIDLGRPPLMRLSWIALPDHCYRLVWSFHHTVIDGWSLPLVMSEVLDLYQLLRRGEAPQLPPAPSYESFIRRLHQQDPSDAETFWREFLEGFSAPTPLGLGRRRVPGQSQASPDLREERSALPAGAAAALQELSRRHRLTLSTVVQGMWSLLLSRYSGQSEVVFGLTVSGRPPELERVEKIVGVFINTLPMRVQVDAEATAASWLQEVQQRQMALRSHESTALTEVQGWSQVERGQPLFESIVVFQDYPVDAALRDQHSLPFVIEDVRTFDYTNYPLTLDVEVGQGLAFRLSYDAQEFEPSAVRGLMGHLRTLTEGLAADPEARLRQLPMMPERERRQLMEWNSTAADFPSQWCFHHLFQRQVESGADAAAASFQGEWHSYAHLDAASAGLARLLAGQGAGPETLIALLANRSPEFLIAMLAAFRLGAAYLPLDPQHPAGRMAQVLKQSGAGLLLSGHALAGEAGQALSRLDDDRRPRLEILENLLGLKAIPLAQAAPARTDLLAYVIFTSGSTGKPKGAMLEQAGMINHLYAKIRDLGLVHSDVVAQTAPQCFDISVWQFLAPLLVGGRVEVYSDSTAHDPRRLLGELESSAVTVVETVPSLMRMLLEEVSEESGWRPALKALRWFVPTGEALPPDLCRRWLKVYGRVPLMNAYGPTECSDDVTHEVIAAPPPAAEARVPIGRPLANLHIWLVDGDLQLAALGVAAELCVSGAGVGRGYLGDPSRTARIFVPCPFGAKGARMYRTGDLARYLPDGRIDFLGRIDHQVKVRGFRIELGEIEALLGKHPAVRQCVVLAPEDSSAGKRLVAYFVSQAPDAEGGATGPSSQQLNAFLLDQLPGYMVPSAFAELEAMPLTPNGKIDRKALLKIEPTASNGHRRAPVTPTEQLLAGIWSEVLGIPEVRAEDNFFELGGHSLLATQVASRIRRVFQLDLGLRTIFEASSLTALARRIDEASQSDQDAAPPLVRADRRESPPLSFAQQRLWFLDQLEPGIPLYNIPISLRLAGPLDAAVLEACLNEILRRHEVLRTSFPSVDGKPVQLVREDLPAFLPQADLSRLPEALQEAELERLADLEARACFDLASGPLLRVRLVRLGHLQHALSATMHHIASDGWSTAVLVQELTALYEAFSQGRPSPLPELPIQYADFSSWQRQWLDEAVMQTQLSYWRERLQGAEVLQFPTDRPRPALPDYRGAKQAFSLPDQLSLSLRSLSRQEGVTLFMTLLAAFQILLSRYSGQSDIGVGTPIANRNRLETEALIGFFVNTLVLRSDLSGDPGFGELLERVRTTALEAYSHQDVPFEQVVEAVQPQRALNREPLFQVMFAFQNAPMPQLDLGDLELTVLSDESNTSKFDLTLVMEELEDGLAGTVEYSTELFDASTIRRMTEGLQTLLQGALEDRQASVGRLPLLSQAQRHQMLREWNAPAPAPAGPSTLQSEFEKQSEAVADAVAAVCGDEQLSYAALEGCANRLARCLMELGAGPELLVGIFMERRLELVTAMLGALKAGAAYLPLDPAYPPQRLAFMLSDASAETVLTEKGLVGRLPESLPHRICLDGDDWQPIVSLPAERPRRRESPRSLAYAIYTSGSTGRPKGVPVRHSNLVRLFDATQHWFGFGGKDVWTLFHSSAFDFSVWEVWGALLRGGRLVVVPYWVSRSPQEFLQLLSRQQVTVLNQTPSAFRQLIQADRASKPSPELALRLVILGGEALDPHSLDPWLASRGDRNPQLINMYGITETTVFVTYRPMTASDLQGHPGSRIGIPIPDLQLYLLDRHGQPVPVGVAAEIYVGGQGVAGGYLGRPALTAQRFMPHSLGEEAGSRLYRSGDLARHRPDGDLEYLGRGDHQVKIRGFRIELGEIEAALLQHPSIREAAVLAGQGTEMEGRLTAYLVPEAAPPDEAGLEAGEVRDFLRRSLPDYMTPSAYVTLQALPLTPNGKLDRQALAQITPGQADGRKQAPATAAEELLAGIWADVLGLEEVGRDDNFFELGGDSILSIQIVSRARQAGIGITARDAFQHQTIAQLAAAAEFSQPIEAEQGIVEGRPPLTPIQKRFFDRNPENPHHWNQSVLLESREELNAAALDEAVACLLRHHDALRMRFSSGGQFIAATEESRVLSRFDLSALRSRRQKEALESAAARLQASLDLQSGPLLRAAYFHLGPQRHGRLLFIVHHLVVDAVSFRILMEDLLIAYHRLSQGQTVILPAKTSSFKEYAQRLVQLANSPMLESELSFWLDGAYRETIRLPADFPGGANSEASGRTVSASLERDQTQALLQEVPRAYRTRINDALLTALARTITQWTGGSTLLVDLEGHGRELIVTDIDFSRTVGWFTSIHPTALKLQPGAGPGESLASVKEQLRKIPGRGIGYGLLRFLRDDAASSHLRGMPGPEISFNYLGQYDRALPKSSPFRLADESGGAQRSPRAQRTYLLEVSGSVLNGRLQMSWTYSRNLFRQETIEGLARSFQQSLSALIAHCRSAESSSYTPSDFPLANIDREKLDQVLKKFKLADAAKEAK